MPSKNKPEPAPSYVDTLISELRQIESDYAGILEGSEIYHYDPNSRGGGIVFIGAATQHWRETSDEVTGRRMRTLGQLRDWRPRFQLLFPHPTPEVSKVLKERGAHLERWLVRKDENDHSIPSSIPAAVTRVREDFSALVGLTNMLPIDQWPTRVVLDTNALIDNPNVAAYQLAFPRGYLVHLLPTVLRELDELKRSGRTPELRENASRANRRLKGIRVNKTSSDVINVEADVFLRFEHIEPRGDSLPSWLDLTVPDDRLVASTLLLQSEHPGSQVHVVTGDVNLQTKLSAIGLPFLDPDF